MMGVQIDRQTEIKRLRAAEAELKPRCATAEKQVKQLLAQVRFYDDTLHRFPQKPFSSDLATQTVFTRCFHCSLTRSIRRRMRVLVSLGESWRQRLPPRVFQPSECWAVSLAHVFE
jgi:hypothetical protein